MEVPTTYSRGRTKIVIRRKLPLLKLVDVLGNVAKACSIMDYPSDTLYEVGRGFPGGRSFALIENKRGPKTRIPPITVPFSR